MKKVFLILVVFFSLFITNQIICNWTYVYNAGGNRIVKVLNFNNNLLVAGNSIKLSTNNGQSFNVIFVGSNDMNSLSLVDGKLWIGCYYDNYYSTNGGLNWINVNLNKFTYDFCSYNTNWVFAGTESNKCYFTNNGGANWGQCTSIWDDVLCFEPINGKLLAGTSQNLYYTTPNSYDWVLTGSLPSCYISDILKSDSLIYLATNLGVWKSSNNSVSFAPILSGTFVLSLEKYNQYLFAGTYDDGFYYSSNNGTNWIQRNEGFGNVRINSIAVVNGYVYAGTQFSGLWKRQLSEVVGINQAGTEIPRSYNLSQNYPNPFNPNTNIRYSIPSSVKGEMSNVKLVVFDILGKEIETLVNEKQSAGTYEVTFDGSDYPSGVYFYKLSTGDYTETKKMILMK